MKSTLIRILLVIMGIYLFIDSVIHLFAFRFQDVAEIWPNNAIAFSKFLSQIYGSFILLISLIILEISRKVEQYKNLIFIIGLWSLFHGTLLLYLSVIGFFNNFEDYSSLYFYIKPSIYQAVEFIEGLFLIVFAMLALIYTKKKK